MKKYLLKAAKVLAIILLGLTVIILIGYGLISFKISNRIDKTYAFDAPEIHLDTTKSTIQRGKHLADIKGCFDCHGGDLSGKAFLNEPGIGSIYASNITYGKGGLSKDYNVQDWAKALRHGINKQGKSLWLMPSQEIATLSKTDLQAIISFCMIQPEKDHVLPENNIGPMMKVLAGLKKVPLLTAELINHQQAIPDTISRKEGLALGKYLSVSCTGCHKSNLKGGAADIPGMPAIPDITQSGNLKHWKFKDFQQVLQSGIKPDGKKINPREMPWTMTAKYTDIELKSLFQYLKSL